jgi:hypothetical protein
MAVDATGWIYLQATNSFLGAPASEANFSSGITPPLVAPAGTAYVRYQLEFDNTGTGGGDVYFDDCVLNKVNLTDPDITSQSGSVTIYAGVPATFTVVGIMALRGETLKYQWQKNGTNLPAAGGVNDIVGATTNATLYLTNCVGADAGLFDVVVSDSPSAGVTNSIRSVPVTLTVLVLSPLQKANVLGANSGFENAPAWPLWEIFNGCYFASSNNVYVTSTNTVNVYDGNWVCLVGDNGDRDNGFHHAFGTGANCTVVASVTPGSIWKAGGWAYISSSDDYTAGNTCRLQIWFKDADGNTVPGTRTYESFKIYGLAYTNADMQYTNIDTSSPNYGQLGYHAQLPRDQWCFLTVSNVLYNIYDPITTNLIHNAAGIGLGDDIPEDTLPNGVFMVPTNTTPPTAQINFQVYEYCPVAGDTNSLGQPPEYPGSASDAVYWDDMQLIQIVPVTNLTASVSGNNINLSFAAGAGLDYSVLYKTNLTDATWSVLASHVIAPMSWQTNSASVGTSYPVTVSDSLAAQSRFYRVLVQ